ncbi:Centrosomal and Immune Signaling Modulator [Abortiporus biennis]
MPPFAAPLNQVPFPALYLYSLNDSFLPKHISLANNQRVKIGRQTNAKTVPAERNGYFDSKVLSRQHAEVWEEGGKIFIKDVKSSNGTFINGERLSAEAVESDPYPLKSGDAVEFGIDIVGEDNKTIIHHKVAACVFCVFSEADLEAVARYEAQHNPSYGGIPGQGGPGVPGNTGFNFTGNQPGANGVSAPQRRSTVQQGLLGMGGMGGNARQPGKSGISFDHILNRLQGELQKSRDTGNELHSISNAMNEIHETLGGSAPANLPAYPQTLPPVVPPSTQQPEPSRATSPPNPQDSTVALTELQAQLHETQLSLASHVEKIRALETMLAEHDNIKREVSSMRDMMEERKREVELLRMHTQNSDHLHRHLDDGEGEYVHDDDDARSVSTVVPHELERVEEEDEEQLAAEEEEEERRRRRDELGRPRTPEPTGMGIAEDDDEHETDLSHTQDDSHLRPPSPSTSSTSAVPNIPDDLLHRLNALTVQLETALELSRSLEAQHATAQSTISQLESKVTTLESLVQTTQSQVQVQSEVQRKLVEEVEAQKEASTSALSVSEERQSLTAMLNEWKKGVEGQWSGVREEWAEERERLHRAKEEFESRVQNMEDKITKTAAKIEGRAAFQDRFHSSQTNGSAKLNGVGIFTPPSPRSLSSASTRSRTRRRRPSSSRSRSRSLSPVMNGDDSLSPEHDEGSPSSSRVHRRTPWSTDDSSASDSEPPLAASDIKRRVEELKNTATIQFPITPEPSLRDHPVSEVSSSAPSEVSAEALPKKVWYTSFETSHVSAIIGVLVVGAATVAVMYRIQEAPV